MEFTISTGKSRHEIRWHNERWPWDRLVERLKKTHRTTESVKDYKKATKDRRSEIKDIGGFVGGAIHGGRRKKGSVQKRSMLTLDADFATPTLWDDFKSHYDCAAVMYSTHSHTAESPRYRLIVPLKREVSTDEHEAIGRRMAEVLGIDQFDDTTYQAERLMYWPSTPADGEYICRVQEGKPLDVEAMLATYDDWHDVSQWPVSSRQTDIIRRELKKQGDPLTKPGIIGLFCRAYTIQEVISAYLSDEYEPTADDNRFTYRQGSTAAGLVVYDNVFAYSHHNTDPCSGKLVNAFDLVRLHLYGVRDDDAKDNTPNNRLPSYLAMEALVAKDKKVRRLQSEELDRKARDDFKSVIEGDWEDGLQRDKNGRIYSSANNILHILTNAPGLKDNIRRDDMLRMDVISGDLPWRSIDAPGASRKWSNDDDAQMQIYMERVYDITGKDKILNAKTVVATNNRYHPVRDYLTPLEWDGRKRIDTLFIDYLGAVNDELTKAVTRKALTAAVKRIMEPGCKYDYITVLQGPEGIGKSTLLAKLGGEWFNDSITDLAGKEGMEQIQGCWIIEAGELQGIKRNEVEGVKAFISRQVDEYRPAYGRIKESLPRQCVFFATTNEGEFLKGDNGNRRFWVIPCLGGGRKKVKAITPDERDQIWAEALHYYKQGERLYLDDDLESQMRKRQRDFNELSGDVRQGMIAEYLDKKLPAHWPGMDLQDRRIYLADDARIEADGVNMRQKTCAFEILCECLGERPDERSRYKAREINAIMDRMPGWQKASKPLRFSIYGVQKGYTRTISVDDDDL